MFGVYSFRLKDCWIDGVRSGMVNYRYGALWRGKSCSQSASSKLVVKLRGSNYVMLALPVLGITNRSKVSSSPDSQSRETRKTMTLHSLFFFRLLSTFIRDSLRWAIACIKRQSEGHDVCRQVPSHMPRHSQPCFSGGFCRTMDERHETQHIHDQLLFFLV